MSGAIRPDHGSPTNDFQNQTQVNAYNWQLNNMGRFGYTTSSTYMGDTLTRRRRVCMKSMKLTGC